MDANLAAEKLEQYTLQLLQVEAALEKDPHHPELLKLKQDLNELIEITQSIINEDDSSNGNIASDTPSPSDFSNEPSTNSSVLERLSQLPEDEYKTFLWHALDKRRPHDLLHDIIKRYSNCRKSVSKKRRKLNEESNPTEDMKKLLQNVLPAPKPLRLAEIPLICRGTLMDGPVFLAMAKIRLKQNPNGLSPGAVAIVNSKNGLVFWSWIFWPEDDIACTFSKHTGVLPENLKVGLPINEVATILSRVILAHKVVVVGYQVKEDLALLQIPPNKTEDIADYFKSDDGYVYSLKSLNHLGKGEDSDSPVIESAKSICSLYKWMKKHESEYPTFSSHPSYGQIKRKYEGITEAELQELPDEILQKF